MALKNAFQLISSIVCIEAFVYARIHSTSTSIIRNKDGLSVEGGPRSNGYLVTFV